MAVIKSDESFFVHNKRKIDFNVKEYDKLMIAAIWKGECLIKINVYVVIKE